MGAYLLSMNHLVATSVLNDIAVYGCRAMFFISAVLLMAIVLMQEGKGGGLASALGGQGAETFGVSTGGVNKVTLFLAGLFLVSALGHALAFDNSVTASLKNSRKATPGGGGGGSTGGDTEKFRKAIEDENKKQGEDTSKETKEPSKDEPKKDEPSKEAPKEAPKDASKDAPPPTVPPKDGGK